MPSSNASDPKPKGTPEESAREMIVRDSRVQKLESLLAMAGGITHDFNNLLQGILGRSALLLMDMPADSPWREGVREIEKSAQQAAQLTAQMLTFTGRSQLSLRRVHLPDLVNQVRPALEAVAPQRTRIEYRVAPNTPMVEADAARIRQALINLVVNAAEAIGDQPGTIVIATGPIQADRAYLTARYHEGAAPEGLYAFLEVSDTGCGMDLETKSRMFAPFFSTKHPERGLGLSATLGIVRAHHGVLKAQTAPQAGSTFRILLPSVELAAAALGQASIAALAPAVKPSAKPPERRGRPRHAAEIEPCGKPKILVVDDEENVRMVAQMALEKFGFEVLTASGGREGLDVFKRHSSEISAVLLDLTMPDLSGEHVFDEMRHIRDDVPIILSSGYKKEDALARFDFAELAGFIQKPYTPMSMVETMRRITGRSE